MKQPTKAELHKQIMQFKVHNQYLIIHENETLDMYKARLQDIQKLRNAIVAIDALDVQKEAEHRASITIYLNDIALWKKRFNNLEQAQTHNWNYYKTNRAKLTEIIKDLNERVIPAYKAQVAECLQARFDTSMSQAKQLQELRNQIEIGENFVTSVAKENLHLRKENKELHQELNLYKPDEEEVEYLPEPPASIPDPFGFDNDDLPF